MKERRSEPEGFVSATEAARFLGVNRRLLLALARKGIGGSYPIGTGKHRKTWVFRLSELGIAIDHRHPALFPTIRGMIPIRVALAERLFMAYQRGSLKKVHRKEGESWVLRYRVSNAEGRRVENTLPIGLVRDFPSEGDAWREVDKRSLLVRFNDASPETRRVKFNQLAEHYLKVDFGEDAVRPKSDTTTPNVERYVRKHLVARFGQQIAEDITPLEIQRWMKSLRFERKLAWTTISKIRGIMRRIYKIGIQHELVTKNPAATVETRSTTTYKAVIVSPAQTLEILNRLANPLHYALVATCAAQPFGLLRCSRCAGPTSCGMRNESEFPNAGQWGQMQTQRPDPRMALCRCILYLPPPLPIGKSCLLTARRETSCFRRYA